MQNWEVRLREKYPAPQIDGIGSYYFSLDGGGRELIIDAIKENDVKVMLEIGCFLCGSTLQWLQGDSDVKIIGVDPWEAKFYEILERYDGNPVFEPCFSEIDDRKEFIDSVRNNGPFVSAVANVHEYLGRFIPVKGFSPGIMHDLFHLGVQPDLVYFDSNKILDDLEVARSLFPKAIICGDDWTWGADQGYPVRKAVYAYCDKYGVEVRSDRATWLLSKGK